MRDVVTKNQPCVTGVYTSPLEWTVTESDKVVASGVLLSCLEYGGVLYFLYSIVKAVSSNSNTKMTAKAVATLKLAENI